MNDAPHTYTSDADASFSHNDQTAPRRHAHLDQDSKDSSGDIPESETLLAFRESLAEVHAELDEEDAAARALSAKIAAEEASMADLEAALEASRYREAQAAQAAEAARASVAAATPDQEADLLPVIESIELPDVAAAEYTWEGLRETVPVICASDTSTEAMIAETTAWRARLSSQVARLGHAPKFGGVTSPAGVEAAVQGLTGQIMALRFLMEAGRQGLRQEQAANIWTEQDERLAMDGLEVLYDELWRRVADEDVFSEAGLPWLRHTRDMRRRVADALLIFSTSWLPVTPLMRDVRRLLLALAETLQAGWLLHAAYAGVQAERQDDASSYQAGYEDAVRVYG